MSFQVVAHGPTFVHIGRMAAKAADRYRKAHPDRVKESRAAYYERNRERILAKTEAQRAAKAAYDKARYAAKRDAIREQAAARRAQTQPAIKARRKAYYAANKEAIREKADAWAVANPEKAKASARRRSARRRNREADHYQAKGVNIKRGVRAVSGEDVAVLRDAAGGCCAYCFRRARLEIEHCTPISRGGAHDICNIVLACRSCNASKGSRTPLEYLLKWL